MAMWALLSGLRGNLKAYEAVLRDLRRERVSTLFILGDLVGPDPSCHALLERLRNPRTGGVATQCVVGWWDEQLLAEWGYRGRSRADGLRAAQGEAAVESLLNAVDQADMAWLANLPFGFRELDCALLHGSSADVSDSLSSDSSPLLLLDRLTRMDVNRLFTGRSGEQFCVELSGGLDSNLQHLAGVEEHHQSVPARKVIGVGCVNPGPTAGPSTYCLYNPGSDQVFFQQVVAQRGFA